mmetsp:Transcript_11790/g.15340  ORF Transcript_11790/g.15340 Transcript_11790/m.15340 type:complete len:125 (+) Transcript_11790:90-464(+)|eukprot:CAMPEP_0117755170 /NCGR_PEP_ID=MMETSP0947-20121206/13288_1 /TAXON_ID=44440 /ORGANISM="Chattonella subsalsa, Strain CCMP2191" /LENGTH=124 /DNA_ID=CAMNT_0005574445 /DNA_START=84 /DNA_END=461 /DNA_ORIENTATION=+
MAAEGYDPQRSQVNETQLANFLRSSITGNIEEVPGVGASAKQKLAEGEDSIETTYQLIAKYLSLKGENVDCIEHCERFWLWLKSQGINSYRSGIVLSIAEKVNTMMPGIYDGALYEQDDEEEKA